jgi:pimeloyl-ACP methyl ester carboxylesterase
VFGDDVFLRPEVATVRGEALHFWRIGRDRADRGFPETVLLLHGLGGDHVGLAELAELLDEYDVVVPDLPGFGDSAALAGAHTLSAYAEAVDGLREWLGLDRFHLVGHSLGASIALVYAARFGAHLDGLCLLNPVSTASGPTAWLGRSYYRIAALAPAWFARLWLVSRPAVALSDAFVIVTEDRARRRWILRQDYRNYRRSCLRAMVESFLSYFDTPFDELAAEIAAPALVITGDRDGIAPPAEVSALAGRIPTATLLIVPGGGHLLPVEDPDLVGTAVREFLADLRLGRMAVAEGE